MYWIVHNFVRVHFTTRQVPAVALGVLEYGLSLNDIFFIQKIAKCRTHVALHQTEPVPSAKITATMPAKLHLVPRVLQFRAAPRLFTPTFERAGGDQRDGFGQVVAAVYAGDGGGFDRARVVAQRGLVLPGTAVAAAADGLKHGAG